MSKKNIKTPPITFDKKKYRGLKKAYNNAVNDNQDSFTFDKNEYLTAYAKYLLEYLEGVLIKK